MLINDITPKEILHLKEKNVNLTWQVFSKVLILEDCKVTLSTLQERVRVLALYRCTVSGNIRKNFPNLLVLDIMESDIRNLH